MTFKNYIHLFTDTDLKQLKKKKNQVSFIYIAANCNSSYVRTNAQWTVYLYTGNSLEPLLIIQSLATSLFMDIGRNDDQLMLTDPKCVKEKVSHRITPPA